MIVVHICQRDDPDVGDTLLVAEALVLEQHKAGVDAWIIFLYGGASRIANSLTPFSVCLGLESSRQTPKGILALRKSIKRINPDIIHAHEGILWPRLVYLSLNIPVVTHAPSVADKYDWGLKSEQILREYRILLGAPRENHGTRPKVLVCQHGSRHRYAIPRMLNEAGMMCAFYTDSSGESNIGKCVKRVGLIAPAFWTSAARWKITGIPSEKIFSSDAAYYYELMQAMGGIRKKGLRLYHQRHRLLSRKMKKWGLQDANVVYSMYHENLDFVRWAKDRGALSVVDVFISPITDEIMKRESTVFPEWAAKTSEDEARFERDLWSQTARLADLLICPSEWVAEGVLKISPEYADKIKVVPYGCSIDYLGKVNEPVPGRVLFAGRDPLRKGLHYLSEAATRLKKTIPALDVRIAGELPENVVRHPICKDLNFLGQLNGHQMREEFLSADVLVLPALSEGFAGVVAEAIGAGCPVIITKEAGSPVINGREGLVVPSRNVEALADAIRRMITDRQFRSNCSANCLGQVSFYSEEQWMERLVTVLNESLYTCSVKPSEEMNSMSKSLV